MAFFFTMRSTPTSHRRDPSSTSTLPVIEEDGTLFTSVRAPPPVPPRSSNRPAHSVFGLGAPSRLNYEGLPPDHRQSYTAWAEGPNDEKLSDARRGINNNKHIAKRGGWRRLALIALVAIACIVALVVGLVVGLRSHHHTSSSKDASSTSIGSSTGSSTGNSSGSSSSPQGGASGTVAGGPTNPASNTTFPAGSYSIETFLDTVSTDCTSNSATWTCYPYLTYATSPSQSAATFDWIITPVEGTKNYTISSTENYFSIVFSNASMSLMDAGTDHEAYFFQISMQKPTKPAPAAALTSSNVASTCYFNETTFQAYLYTKMEKSYPANSTSSTNTTEAFTPWPYAVKVEQIAGSGSGTPTCVDASGNSLGDFSLSDDGQLCDCLYLNTGT